MKVLILFDRKFPYKSGEAFLENEIDEIAANFDKVYIYPIDVWSRDSLTREIRAKNVEPRIVEKNSLKRRQLSYVLHSLGIVPKSKEKGILKKIIDAYFLASVDAQSQKIINDLELLGITEEDTVYLYSYWLYTTAAIAYTVYDYLHKKSISVVVFSRAHRFDIYEEKRKYGFLPQRNELFSGLQKIFACSDNGSEYLRNRYPQYMQKIDTAYLGTYDHGLGKVGKRDTFKIVSCSRLADVKRVNLIIDALASLENSGLKIEWTHLGGGELLDTYRDMAKEKLGWMKYHLDGAIPNSAVYEFYRTNEVHLFINTSSSEGLPVSIMEAISFGIPVVATDVGGTSEIVVDDVSGTLIPENFEVLELAQCIKKYATMKDEEYSSFRKSTRGLWEKYYQAPKNYAQFAEMINNLKV